MSSTMPRWATAYRSAGSARRTWPTRALSTIRRPVSASIPPTVACSSMAKRTTPKAGRWRTSSGARRTATAMSSPGSATWPTRISSPMLSPAIRPWWRCSTTRRRPVIMPPAPQRLRETIAARSTSTSATSRPQDSRPTRPPQLVAVGDPTNTSADVHNLTGGAPPATNNIESNSQAGHVTGFERPEDGAWDTIDHNKFYFVTTASITGHSKLWELDFADAKNPTLGGNIKMLLDGTEGQLMFDNITVSQDGKITL